MGAGKVGNYDVVIADAFRRDDDVEDDRINNLMELIRTRHDFSDHIWEAEETPEVSLDQKDEADVNNEASENDESVVNDGAPENDEASESVADYHTPKGSKNQSATSIRVKKRLPDRGMEKRKHKVLSTGPKQAPFNEDMKAFVSQLFEQSFSRMEQRLQKQMADTLAQMRAELKASQKEASVEVELGEPSPKKPSPEKPSPTKPSTSQPPLRRSTRGEASQSSFDVNFSQADEFIPGIGTQGVERLTQTSYVPGFDPSQTNKGDEWWTPRISVRDSIAPLPSHWEKWNKEKGLQLTDSPLANDGSPQSSLYYCSEESWMGFTEWVKKPTPLPLGPSIFNFSIATRIEMDAFMFIWRVNTTLKRWNPSRVAFMSAMFCLQIDAAYSKFLPNKKAYELLEFLLGYGRGELPSHGRTDQVWGVDVDRLYFSLFVNGNHWVAVCVNIIEKRVEVFDCGRGKNRQYVEKFAAMIPRIVKAVGPPERQKQLLLASYSIVDVPMKLRLNKSCCDCGVYALKHLECHMLGIDLSLVDDEIIMVCRQKIWCGSMGGCTQSHLR
ncbi:hypothetical protein Bca52824_033578 [Brassica carinata]|uniref:Ubiquitin-like protease family profile domain-containing protein n=1 Tax=Brassica carinata TaxID=52824 RepID=A0A8X7SEL3_BRACI|nr:hypothetical protein Bca52824_033578 [Brassica carinata]